MKHYAATFLCADGAPAMLSIAGVHPFIVARQVNAVCIFFRPVSPDEFNAISESLDVGKEEVEPEK